MQDFLSSLNHNEYERQKNTLNLIASENYPSPAVLSELGSIWSLKYGEGYPGKRYYAGNANTDKLEKYVQDLALQVFDLTGEYGVNVQVLSGSPANMMVYLGFLEYGDTIMSLNVANGGHISHLHPTSNWNKFFKRVNYDVVDVSAGENEFKIDIDDYTQKLAEYKPKLVIIGFSAYPKKYEFEEMVRLAHDYGALVLADIAHINGLVAAGLHDTPFKVGMAGADFVSMTTHKTLRGPRGALLFAKKELIGQIDKTIFPGTSGGPHFHQIAAVGRCLEETLGIQEYPDNISFADYQRNVLTNTKALENGLKQAGITIISPTENHLCLIKLPDELDSLEMQKKLEKVGIITNRNSIPFDPKTPWRPSGMRLGMAALTSRGINQEDSFDLGKMIGEYILDKVSDKVVEEFVKKVVGGVNWFY